MSSDVVVHVVDDEEPVRKSLAFLISTAGYAVRLHSSAIAFLNGAPYPHGHCLVADLQMPDMDGVALLKRLREIGHALPSIVLTGHGDVRMAVAAMKEGAIDFIEKPFEDTLLLDAIEHMVDQAGEGLQGDRDRQDIKDRLASLSERERQVFDGIVTGKANKTIAIELDLSPRTVEVYRAHVMAKMNCKTLPGLVRIAMEAGVDMASE